MFWTFYTLIALVLHQTRQTFHPPVGAGVCVTFFLYPAPFNPPYGGGPGWGFLIFPYRTWVGSLFSSTCA